MCRCERKKLVGLVLASFGAGIFMSYFLPVFFLALLEGLALAVAGILLLSSDK